MPMIPFLVSGGNSEIAFCAKPALPRFHARKDCHSRPAALQMSPALKQEEPQQRLTPDLSPLGKDAWTPFLEDHDTQSYSYLLDRNATKYNPPLTTKQLNEWFAALHPSSYGDDRKHEAWTPSYYQGELLLRQTAWCVLQPECECAYGYADTWQPIARSPQMKRVIQEISQTVLAQVVGSDKALEFNSCNLNYYPQGGGVGFHADDEFLFDGTRRPVRIVSLSLCSSTSQGARKFQVKKSETTTTTTKDGDDDEDTVHQVILGHGDIMTMEGMFQKHYMHSVWPGDDKTITDDPWIAGERINLTWRTIVQHLDGSEECRGMTCPLHRETTD